MYCKRKCHIGDKLTLLAVHGAFWGTATSMTVRSTLTSHWSSSTPSLYYTHGEIESLRPSKWIEGFSLLILSMSSKDLFLAFLWNVVPIFLSKLNWNFFYRVLLPHGVPSALFRWEATDTSMSELTLTPSTHVKQENERSYFKICLFSEVRIIRVRFLESNVEKHLFFYICIIKFQVASGKLDVFTFVLTTKI
jgi:hypothetical protein